MTRYSRNQERELVGQIVRAVAWETGHDPEELEPIANTVDPDAVQVLFGRSSKTDARSLTFEYEGCEVLVQHDEFTVT